MSIPYGWGGQGSTSILSKPGEIPLARTLHIEDADARSRRHTPGVDPLTAPPARPPRVCLLGAAGDTGNLGVTALQHATIAALAQRLPGVDLVVLDNGLGERWGQVPTADGEVSHRRMGLRLSRRLYRNESLGNVRVSARLGRSANPVATALLTADAVLDVSGGDSFSDLYGLRRYRMVAEPKRFVLRHHRPLILLPQTYGPFRSARPRRQAAEVLAGATAAFARDADSHEVMRSLLGPRFDPSRHRQGVDVAFNLAPTRPRHPLPLPLAAWLADATQPCIGLNVSGLLANDAHAATRYELAATYRETLVALLHRLLEVSAARVVLMPHVHDTGVESDRRAAEDLRARLPSELAARVAVAPSYATPGEAKWLIGQFDWFCGTRMHATIAALSSGIPVAAIAYSPKTRGVFATCGLGEEVADARHLSERALVEQLIASWRRRAAVAETLARRLPQVTAAATDQMDAVAAHVSRLTGDAIPDRRRKVRR